MKFKTFKLGILVLSLSALNIFTQGIYAQGEQQLASIPIEEEINKNGVEAGIRLYIKLKKDATKKYDFNERPLFRLGYSLIQKKNYKDGLMFLKFLVNEYPNSVYGLNYLALSYFYLAHSENGNADSERAKETFIKVLILDPDNNYAKFYLEKIFVVQNYTKKAYNIPMRDGIKLTTIVYSPNDKSKQYPILLNRRPYGLGNYSTDKISYFNSPGPSKEFNSEKYIFVFQDVRGRFMSEGDFVHVRPILKHKKNSTETDESTDTFDTLEWLVNNIESNNGKSAIWGTSYMGFYSVLGLIDPHPSLVLSAPAAPIADWFLGDDPRRNGALYYFHAVNFFNTQGVVQSNPTPDYPVGFFEENYTDVYDFFLDLGPIHNVNDKLFKGQNNFWNEIIKHNTYDTFWKERSTLPHLKDIKTPVLNIGGWFDSEDLFGTFKTYKTIERNNPDIQNTIVIGPWYHGGWSDIDDEFLGDIKFNNGEAAEFFRKEIELPIFNYYLKGKPMTPLPEALVYETGTNKWRKYDSWPPKEAKTKIIYFQQNKSLSFDAPKKNRSESFDEYVSNPNNPVPFYGKVVEDWGYEFMHGDQRFASDRTDVLTYQTDMLEENMTIVGPIIANLFVSTDKTAADWVVKIIDVFPDSVEYESPNKDVEMSGYQMLVRGDIIRGKFRDSFELAKPFEPNKITEVVFEILDINHTFLPGHKLMIQVQSSWFPLYDSNPQKFMNISEAEISDFQVAKHRLYHSKKHPSKIEIKIIENK